MIGTTFYHGSAVPSDLALKINWDRDNTFGPAVYLTSEPTHEQDITYEVKLKANQLLTINLDKSFGEQTVEAKEAILKTRKRLGLPKLPSKNTNVKELLKNPDSLSKATINKLLLEHGIWMIYGSPTDEHKVQYAVIDDSAIELIAYNENNNLFLKSAS